MPSTITRRRVSKVQREEEERRIRIEIEIETYNPLFRLCREIGHPWSIPVPAYFVNDGEPYRMERCVRCTLLKKRHMVPGGKCSGYQYPAGYHLLGVSRQDFRDLSLKQANPVFESEEALIEALALAEREAVKAATRRGRKKVA